MRDILREFQTWVGFVFIPLPPLSPLLCFGETACQLPFCPLVPFVHVLMITSVRQGESVTPERWASESEWRKAKQYPRVCLKLGAE